MKYFDPFNDQWENKPFKTQQDEISWLLRKISVLKKEKQHVTAKFNALGVVLDAKRVLSHAEMAHHFDEKVTKTERLWIPKSLSRPKRDEATHLAKRIDSIVAQIHASCTRLNDDLGFAINPYAQV